MGKIVDTISHSKYWKDSVIFVVEDDSQDGPDHIDGHRAPVQIISPWAQHKAVDDTYYSQITMIRTIEQILGAQPLNEKLAAATPMFGAFTGQADDAPFTAVANQVPLTEGVKDAPACGLDSAGGSAEDAAAKRAIPQGIVPTGEKATAAAWARWLTHQHTMGNGAVPDYAGPELMNRYTWYASHNWSVPYPGDSQIYPPSKAPGAFIPSSDTN